MDVPSLSLSNDSTDYAVGGSNGFNETQQLENILQTTQLLLQHQPLLLYLPSQCTNCTVLHVAIRNYGNFLPLIQLILHADDPMQKSYRSDDDNNSNKDYNMMMTTTACETTSAFRLPLVLQPNQYGDLPLHVACSVGVPWNVLTTIVQETLRQEAFLRQKKTLQHHLHEHQRSFATSHVWSVNHSGYTPVDLEWIRHIEAGKGLLSARSFYPLEASGVRKHCRKQDDFYRDLLEDAVRQVICNEDQSNDSSSQTMDWSSYIDDHNMLGDDDNKQGDSDDDRVTSTFGLLLHRIIFMVQAAFRGRTACTIDEHCLLHAVSALCRPFSQSTHGFALPRPMMEFFIWMCPHQIMLQDAYGRVPLHYAVATVSEGFVVSDEHAPPPPTILNTNHQKKRMTRILDDWVFACQSLMLKDANAAKTSDTDGRLPLHLALMVASDVGIKTPTQPVCIEDTSNERKQCARWIVVQKLVDCYPESVELRDPVTGLFPFQLAAASGQVPLESVYVLLRRSPNLVLLDAK
jgi:hypothetical protein